MVSTTMVVVVDCTKMLVRNLLSFLLGDVQTAQWQPIIGIPVLVPVPKKVNVNCGAFTLQNYCFATLKLQGLLALFI